MRKKKKQSYSCAPQYDACNPCEEKINTCKPVKQTKISNACSCNTNNVCKKPVKKYVEDICGDYEITCVDKCVNLAKKAEELFDKACECDAQAVETYNQAKECEKSAKLLEQKANNLLQNACCTEKESKEAECKAKQLLEKADELSAKAKCLYQEGKQIQKEAEANCESAKCLYEKAQCLNEKAKELYSQAMKCDEKALECYKNAGEKMKEYEIKSKKCEDMISKCGNALDKCSNKVNYKKETPCEYVKSVDICNTTKPSSICKYEEYDYSCNPPKKKSCISNKAVTNNTCKMNTCNTYDESEDIIYVEDYDICKGNLCSTYVSPMYDMTPMQCVGGISSKYPSLDKPYMNVYIDQYQDMNDMWMNYYMYMQNMYMQNMIPFDKM